jgi:parallel beta-helix repeat protein
MFTNKLSTTVVSSNLIPETNNSQDVGSNTFRWNNAFITNLDVSTLLKCENLEVTNNVRGNLIPQLANQKLGLSTQPRSELNVYSSNAFGVANSLLPFSDSYLLGSATQRWGNVSTLKLNTTAYVNPYMPFTQIQALVSNTQFNIVEFEQGTYTFPTMLNINRSNITLRGNQALVILGVNANEPILMVGDVLTNPPTIVYENITIQDFILDGNRANQTSETSASKYWIYNNCITINLCHKVLVSGCKLLNSISGGCTITYESKYVTFDNCHAEGSRFDGLTAYGSQNIIFSNNHLVNHTQGAGISIDLNVLYCEITNNVITGNKEGIFAREIDNCIVTGNILCNNIADGFFLSGYNLPVNDRNNNRWTITGNNISNNGAHGLFLQSINDFSISGNTINNNNGNGINWTSYAGLPFATYGVSKRNNISGNVITGNHDVGIYNDGTNSWTNGARDNFLVHNIIKNNTNGQIVGDFSSFTIQDDLVVETKKLTLKSATGNVTTLMPSATGSVDLTLPPNAGSNGQFLQTNGAGLTSWGDLTTSSNLVVPNKLTVGSNNAVVNFQYTGGTMTSVVNTGTAMAMPSIPARYLAVTINGVTYAIPLFNQSTY